MENIMVGGRIVILLMAYFLLFKAIRKLPTKIANTMTVFVVTITLVIIFMGYCYPEILEGFLDDVNGLKNWNS